MAKIVLWDPAKKNQKNINIMFGAQGKKYMYIFH